MVGRKKPDTYGDSRFVKTKLARPPVICRHNRRASGSVTGSACLSYCQDATILYTNHKHSVTVQLNQRTEAKPPTVILLPNNCNVFPMPSYSQFTLLIVTTWVKENSTMQTVRATDKMQRQISGTIPQWKTTRFFRRTIENRMIKTLKQVIAVRKE